MADRKSSPARAATLLVELLTEELPPKALKVLGQEFSSRIRDGLASSGLVDAGAACESFATPRRLAVKIAGVLDAAPDTQREVQGPSVSAPPQAVEGFAKKCGLPVATLKKLQTPKGEIYVAQVTTTGQKLAEVLAGKIEAVLKMLPVPKVMRWGAGDAQFARPVHGLIMMHGANKISGEVLGVASSKETLGHRFLSNGSVAIENADDYEETLRKSGKVIASFTARREEIINKIKYLCDNSRVPVASDALYDEITALVEAPTVYEGTFSADFLEVPEECLILSMQQHQKYVPLRDKATGKLLPRFLFVSNIETKQPQEIIHGNERVLRARLSDAKFFYDQDRKTRLADRVPKLGNVVYHNKLGSQLERVERIEKIAAFVASKINTDLKQAERAARLSKADLLTEMVGEFPELQGIMGGYYARNDGELPAVAEAIKDQYRRRTDEDEMGSSDVSDALCLADRAETLIGIWGIGLQPTGDKDPYGLRRAAIDLFNLFHFLGLKSKLQNRQFDLPLADLLSFVETSFKPGLLAKDTVSAVTAFVYERYRNQLFNAFETNIVDSVVSVTPPLEEVAARVRAVVEFKKLPEAAALAAANKRAGNILRKEGFSGVRTSNSDLFIEDAEKTLASAINEVRGKVDTHFSRKQFVDCLKTLAGVRSPVDAFFDKVLVNADDPKIRENRLSLLSELNYLLNRVADISRLAA